LTEPARGQQVTANTPLLAAFDQQADWCNQPAPFTAHVLRRSQLWLAETADAYAVFDALASDPLAAAVPLRWVGGLHLLALRGLLPWAQLWPPAAGAQAVTDLQKDAQIDAAISLAWLTQQAVLRDALSRPPQTNEVQRSAALLPGLLFIAHSTRLPLSLLEIGASAGLNLWCDRWALAPLLEPDAAPWSYGPADAPLTLRPAWIGAPPPLQALLQAPLQICRRAGCDAEPIDLTEPGQAERLASFIWPDQVERLQRLRAAQTAACGWMASERLSVQALSAARFVQQELRTLRTGMTTVLMHSVVWQYIAADEQQSITAAVHDAASHATATNPLAWLRFEPASLMGNVELRCQLWPGGADHLLARCHPHGAHIHWLAGA